MLSVDSGSRSLTHIGDRALSPPHKFSDGGGRGFGDTIALIVLSLETFPKESYDGQA